jgi:hypothetical protein
VNTYYQYSRVASGDRSSWSSLCGVAWALMYGTHRYPPAPGKKPMRENSAFLRTGVFAFLTTDAVPSSVRSWRNDKSGEMIRTLRKRFRCGTGREPPGPRVECRPARAPRARRRRRGRGARTRNGWDGSVRMLDPIPNARPRAVPVSLSLSAAFSESDHVSSLRELQCLDECRGSSPWREPPYRPMPCGVACA